MIQMNIFKISCSLITHAEKQRECSPSQRQPGCRDRSPNTSSNTADSVGLLVLVLLGFSIVDLGNRSLVGVSPPPFAKQVFMPVAPSVLT